jgi:drug/metabolite transporter (DMT)-like permease
MQFASRTWHRYAMTFVFVLLWSSGAIFSRLALAHAAPFTVLLLRFALALVALLVLASWRRRLWPATGTRLYVALTGLVLVGGYSSFYLLSLDHGITPGVLATILGAQPILTPLSVAGGAKNGRFLRAVFLAGNGSSSPSEPGVAAL